MLYLIFERNKRIDMKHSLIGFMFLFCKSPGWNHQKSCETHFSAENISFEIIKVPVWIIGKHVKHTFQPKIFRLNFEFFWLKSWFIHPPPSTHSVHTPISGHCVKCCHLRNMYATCPINVQNGVGQNTFETRKTCDLWLTSHNFFDSVEKIVTVIF